MTWLFIIKRFINLKSNNYISIVLSIIGIGIIIIGIISFCIYKKRKDEIGNDIRRIRDNTNNVNIYVDRTRNILNMQVRQVVS